MRLGIGYRLPEIGLEESPIFLSVLGRKSCVRLIPAIGERCDHADDRIGGLLSEGGVLIAPTGKAFDLDFTTTAKWDGDLLIEEFVFWDSALQAQQLGIA